MNEPVKKALIIGATSSLGTAICQVLARRNYTLFLAGRDSAELEIIATDLRIRHSAAILTGKLDLSYVTFSAEEFLLDVEEKFGNFDTAFLLTGDMGAAVHDEKNIERVVKVNFLQPAKILELMAEKMMGWHGGNIAVISSVAGDRGRQSNYIYGSAKAGLTAFASGLRNKFLCHDVHIMTVKPGFLDTPMTYGMQSPLIYAREKAAESIVKAMIQKKDVVYVPFFWRYIMLIIMLIPEKIFKRLKL